MSAGRCVCCGRLECAYVVRLQPARSPEWVAAAEALIEVAGVACVGHEGKPFELCHLCELAAALARVRAAE